MGKEKGGGLQSDLLTSYFKCFAHAYIHADEAVGAEKRAPAKQGKVGSPPRGHS